MSIISEKREFFLRNIPVNHGSNKDNEIGFPTKHKIKRAFVENGTVVERYVDVYNRFLEGNVPTESVWKKLLHSIAFKYEVPIAQSLDEINQAIGALQSEATTLEGRVTELESEIAGNPNIVEIVDGIFPFGTSNKTIDFNGNKIYAGLFTQSTPHERDFTFNGAVTPMIGATVKIILKNVSTGIITVRFPDELNIYMLWNPQYGTINYVGSIEIPINNILECEINVHSLNQFNRVLIFKRTLYST